MEGPDLAQGRGQGFGGLGEGFLYGSELGNVLTKVLTKMDVHGYVFSSQLFFFFFNLCVWTGVADVGVSARQRVIQAAPPFPRLV